uniref:WW domain-containing protein n=1 Tax=Hemiselmis andersenii TaxID=464988 RepID=A0A7S1DPC9_HEMAN
MAALRSQKEEAAASQAERVASLQKQLSAAQRELERERSGPVPSVVLSDGSRKNREELRRMVPSFDWNSFFGGLDRVNKQSPQSPPSTPVDAPRGAEQPGVPYTPEPVQDIPEALPEGWSLETHQGKPLYVNHAAKTYSWVHPSLSKA